MAKSRVGGGDLAADREGIGGQKWGNWCRFGWGWNGFFTAKSLL